MKILVPTDFSKLSFIAAKYAAALANKTKSQIILIHAVPLDLSARADAGLASKKLREIMQRDAYSEIHAMRKRLSSQYENASFSASVIHSSPMETGIERFAQRNEIDLIVMGTKGASGIKKVLVGSNAAAMVSKSSVPVITVPEKARFNGIRRILYASDLVSPEKEIKVITLLAKIFKASVDVLHVYSAFENKKEMRKKLLHGMAGKTAGVKIRAHMSEGYIVEEEIESHIRKLKPDMIAMFIRKHGFFDKLFGRSATREMSFHTKIPLLSIQK